MMQFNVSGMTCGHCVAAIKQAVTDLDEQAQVEVELASGIVKIESSAGAEAIQAAIEEEGYEVARAQ